MRVHQLGAQTLAEPVRHLHSIDDSRDDLVLPAHDAGEQALVLHHLRRHEKLPDDVRQ